MTNNLITLTIPNDDHVALRAFGKALEEMALAHGAEPQAETLVRQRVGDLEVEYLTRDVVVERLRVATENLQQAVPRMMQELRCEGDELQGKRKEPETDTTAQQVESVVKPFEERMELLEKALSKETPESLATKLQSYDTTTDSTGTPWDERIHSTSKALNSDGTWRLRRKPKDMGEAQWFEFIQSVQDEYTYDEPTEQDALDAIKKATNDLNNDVPIAEAVAPLAVFTEPPVTPPGDDFHTDASVVTEQTVAGIPPIPVPPPVVVPPVREVSTETLSKALAVPYGEPEQVWDFPKLMKFLTERHGKIDVPTVNQLLAVDGLAALTDLNTHPDKIGPFVARVKAHLGE